ncbi:MAG: hypothetical protein IIU14_02975 [Ruminococcus sp.]|nr:hypothetical protein [Ruminococcus sp.]
MNDYDTAPSAAERMIMRVDDFEQSTGLWYSLFGRRILPFLLLIIPVNVVLGRVNMFLMSRFFEGVNLNGSILIFEWIAVMLAFLALAVFLPKAATAAEFALGLGYLFLAFRHHIFHNLLGYSVLISVIVFLLVKLAFLSVEVVRLRVSADDKKNNIERDESGRIIRATEDKVALSENRGEDFDLSESARAVIAENELFFSSAEETLEMSESGHAVVEENKEFFFGGADAQDDEVRLSESDNDYFFN